MRLAVDGKRLVQARTGPARWLEHMLYRWATEGTPFDEIICYTPGPTDSSWASAPAVRHIDLGAFFTPIVWENTRFRTAASKCDVLFGASYTLPIGYRGPSVVSIQGVYEGDNAEPGPWWHKYRYSKMYSLSAHQADIVLVNSLSTRNDIVQYYGVDPGKIRIVYQGVGAPFGWRADRETVSREAQSLLGNSEPFFLFVGKLSPRRNVPNLLRAFKEAQTQFEKPVHLVLVGPNHVGMPLAEEIRANGLEESVTHISHIPQDRLAVLYSTTLAFVLPTTHEGLSATMLEAMACGAPVLTVDHAPLHDGLFEHVWALDAPEVGLLRDALVRLANEESKGNSLRQLGLECASRFSWSRTAKETIEACWEAGQKH